MNAETVSGRRYLPEELHEIRRRVEVRREMSRARDARRQAMADVLAITGYALLMVAQAAVAGVLVYAGACLLGTFAACAAILAAGCVLWCAVALPVIGGGWVSRWLWRRIRRRAP